MLARFYRQYRQSWQKNIGILTPSLLLIYNRVYCFTHSLSINL